MLALLATLRSRPTALPSPPAPSVAVSRLLITDVRSTMLREDGLTDIGPGGLKPPVLAEGANNDWGLDSDMPDGDRATPLCVPPGDRARPSSSFTDSLLASPFPMSDALLFFVALLNGAMAVR